jgi:hypothetical protein
MKPSILFLAICILCSCSRKHSNQKKDIPVALEPHESSRVFSKRAPDNLVQNIYSELVSESPELKELEKQIDDVNDRKADSLSDYEEFTGMNDKYYTSTDYHLSTIRDSVLKEKIKTLINNSQNNYKNRTRGLTDLANQLDANQTTLYDYHEVLKLTRTLPIIEDYQKKNLPSKKPIAAILNDYTKLIQKTDSLSKK